MRVEFQGFHFAVPIRISTFDNARTTLCVVARLQDHHVLTRVLAAHIGAPQKLRGFVASHWTHQDLYLAWHDTASPQGKNCRSPIVVHRATKAPVSFKTTRIFFDYKPTRHRRC
jgi:hypothetical protein